MRALQHRRSRGVTMVEYAIMLGMICAICFGIISMLGKNSSKQYGAVNCAFAAGHGGEGGGGDQHGCGSGGH